MSRFGEADNKARIDDAQRKFYEDYNATVNLIIQHAPASASLLQVILYTAAEIIHDFESQRATILTRLVKQDKKQSVTPANQGTAAAQAEMHQRLSADLAAVTPTLQATEDSGAFKAAARTALDQCGVLLGRLQRYCAACNDAKGITACAKLSERLSYLRVHALRPNVVVVVLGLEKVRDVYSCVIVFVTPDLQQAGKSTFLSSVVRLALPSAFQRCTQVSLAMRYGPSVELEVTFRDHDEFEVYLQQALAEAAKTPNAPLKPDQLAAEIRAACAPFIGSSVRHFADGADFAEQLHRFVADARVAPCVKSALLFSPNVPAGLELRDEAGFDSPVAAHREAAARAASEADVVVLCNNGQKPSFNEDGVRMLERVRVAHGSMKHRLVGVVTRLDDVDGRERLAQLVQENCAEFARFGFAPGNVFMVALPAALDAMDPETQAVKAAKLRSTHSGLMGEFERSVAAIQRIATQDMPAEFAAEIGGLRDAINAHARAVLQAHPPPVLPSAEEVQLEADAGALARAMQRFSQAASAARHWLQKLKDTDGIVQSLETEFGRLFTETLDKSPVDVKSIADAAIEDASNDRGGLRDWRPAEIMLRDSASWLLIERAELAARALGEQCHSQYAGELVVVINQRLGGELFEPRKRLETDCASFMRVRVHSIVNFGLSHAGDFALQEQEVKNFAQADLVTAIRMCHPDAKQLAPRQSTAMYKVLRFDETNRCNMPRFARECLRQPPSLKFVVGADPKQLGASP